LGTIDEIQVTIGGYVSADNENRPHDGDGINRRSPLQEAKAGYTYQELRRRK